MADDDFARTRQSAAMNQRHANYEPGGDRYRHTVTSRAVDGLIEKGVVEDRETLLTVCTCFLSVVSSLTSGWLLLLVRLAPRGVG